MMVATFARGMDVKVQKIKPTLGLADEPDYGFCEATIGRLDMDNEKLASNLSALLQKMSENRVKRKDPTDDAFITRCIVKVILMSQIGSPYKELPILLISHRKCLFFNFFKVDGKSEIGDDFSIIHALVSDKRVKEQEETISNGQKIIAEKVESLKAAKQ